MEDIYEEMKKERFAENLADDWYNLCYKMIKKYWISDIERKFM